MANAQRSDDDMSEETESKIICFSKEMLPCKLLFLTVDTCFTCAFSFHLLFLKSAGLTMTQIGLGQGIVGICSLVPASIVWGSIIDALTKYRTLFYTLLTFISAAVISFIPFLLNFVAITTPVETCFDNTTRHNRTLLLANGVNCSTTLHLQNSNIVTIVMTGYGILATWLPAGLYCFIEGSIVKAVFVNKRQQSYGKQKVFSPIGIAFGNFIAGVAVDYIKPKHLPQFSVQYFVCTPVCLLCIPLLYLITKHTQKEENTDGRNEAKVAVTKQVVEVFKKSHNSIFLMSVFVAGLSFTIYSNFMYVFVYDVMKPTKTLMSLAHVVSTLSDLIVYPFSSKLIKLLGGPIRCITFAMFIYSLRLVLLSFATNIWYVLAIQLLHGVCTSLSWAAMIEQAWLIFPKEVTNSAVGILVSIHRGASYITGLFLGGYLYSKYQGHRLFRGMAILSLMWGIFMMLYFEMKRKRVSSTDRSHPIEVGVRNEIDINDE